MTVSTGIESPAIGAEEREALVEAVRDLLRRRGDSTTVRAAMCAPGRIDSTLWQTCLLYTSDAADE